MRLARIDPHPLPTGTGEQVTYDCSCGQLFARPLAER
jgi:hypothetical protein